MLSCGFSYLYMHEEIIRILTEAGNQGISLQHLVLHVHHASNNLFNPLSMDEVKQRVMLYLRANTRFPGSLIERSARGIYRLNPNSDEARQLLLSFEETQEEEQKEPPTIDEGPTLFG
jgi:hypothetical protein